VVHAEASIHLHRSIQLIKSLGKKAGVSLNPATPLNCLEYVLADLDLVLLMTVNPGFGGQSFIEGAIPKIKALRAMLDKRGLEAELEVDGGVKIDNIARISHAELMCRKRSLRQQRLCCDHMRLKAQTKEPLL
jgi:ribulose-phosphate 3-epimerase